MVTQALVITEDWSLAAALVKGLLARSADDRWHKGRSAAELQHQSHSEPQGSDSSQPPPDPPAVKKRIIMKNSD